MYVFKSRSRCAKMHYYKIFECPNLYTFEWGGYFLMRMVWQKLG